MKTRIIFITTCLFIGLILFILTFRYPAHYAKGGDITNVNTKSIIKQISKVIKKENWVCIKQEDGVRIFTFIFHYIIPDKFVDPSNKTEYGNSLSPEFFEGIMKRLDNERLDENIEIIGLSELEKYQKNNCYPNKNIIILTVDDGWDDSYNYLFPIIKKYQIPFNLAIISSKVSKTAREINNFANESEIREMLDSGLITLASHTMHHFDLRRITIKQKKEEICKSKSDLEKLFNIKINSLVYTSGRYDEESEQFIKKCGYKFAFATGNKYFDASELNSNPFQITRVRVNRKSILDNVFNFNGLYLGNSSFTGITNSGTIK